MEHDHMIEALTANGSNLYLPKMLSGSNAFEIGDIERMNIGCAFSRSFRTNNVTCPVVTRNNNSPGTAWQSPRKPFGQDTSMFFQARKHVLRKNLDAKRLIPAINSTRVFGSGTAVEVTVTLPL